MFIIGFNFKIWERYFAQTNQQHDSRDSSTSRQSNKTDEYIINRAARFKNIPWSEGTRTFADSKYTAGNLEASIRGALWRKVFLEISQNLQENTCARVSFFRKLQASGLNFAKLLTAPFL